MPPKRLPFSSGFLIRRYARPFSGTGGLCNALPTYKVAIIGAGPAGFYTAHHLLNKASPKTQFRLKVDIFDRLPTPFGLSRYGVAPDHPEVKNCEEYLENIMQKYGKESENDHYARFIGNVTVGEDVSLEDLNGAYNSVVLSYGCTSTDNTMDIPGGGLPGVISARQFVNWYNGHPDSYRKEGGFEAPDLAKVEDVTIIGNGNVALDVARILLGSPKSHWKSTDISSEALQVLEKSAVKRVNIVARRGLLESAFTNKEIRELLEMGPTNNIQFEPIEARLLTEISPKMKTLGRVDKRKMTLLEKYSKMEPLEGAQKTWSLQYLKSPVQFVQNKKDGRFLEATVFQKNEVMYDELLKKAVISLSSGTETLKNELVVLSIGYKGSPLAGFEAADILFDARKNRISNREGRILRASSTPSEDPEHNFSYKRGWYTSGWIKNGPQGVIATTMMEAFDTADKVLEDLTNGIHTQASGDVEQLDSVSWQGWQKLDAEERARGKEVEKTREKVLTKEEMVLIACK